MTNEDQAKFSKWNFRMKKTNGLFDLVKIALGIALLVTMAGCVGVVGDGYGGGGVVVAEPDVFLFGGGYDRGRDVHNYSQRGGESRAVAHSSGGGGGRKR